MFSLLNFHFKLVLGALLALSIFVGSRSFAATRNNDATNRIILDTKVVIAESLGVTLISVKDSSRLNQDLNADDLDKVELAMKLEEKFHVVFSNHKIEQANTVKDIMNLVVAAVQKAPADL